MHQPQWAMPPVSSFAEAVVFLEKGIDYERTRRWLHNARWMNLPRVAALLDAMGDPHRAYKVLHVAGTKGKGSTAGAAAHCLHRAGLRTGLLTSPHLVTHRERIRVDGRMISQDEFWPIVRRMQPHVEARRAAEGLDSHRAPTYFEMLTVLALEHFARRGAEWAVVEVGLGGRLDSTNVVSPAVCVITPIGYDHMDKLGETPGEIAAEKGGILKEGVPFVLGRQRYPDARETLRRMATERHCPCWEVGRDVVLIRNEVLAAPASAPTAPVGRRFGLRTPCGEHHDLFTPLLGAHQLDNLAAAVAALEMAVEHGDLAFPAAALPAALADFRIPGRVELLQRQPAFVLDVAHTIESTEALIDALSVHFPGRRVHVVFGCSADKNAEGMLGAMRGHCATLTATQSRMRRARPAVEVAQAAVGCGLADAGCRIDTIPDAWEAVRVALERAEPADVVCVTGSFYVAGEVRAEWAKRHPEAAEET
ncbi:MAG: bifunctional folylpolyglutamate synthase/dihydrofolate synthase [Candidatus Brocadiaceae bacterium]|nr:bifunctional folylpolyglutamate synthase/dihydrofolate synthase [Candidatus Brocadiaceae bacterium]